MSDSIAIKHVEEPVGDTETTRTVAKSPHERVFGWFGHEDPAENSSAAPLSIETPARPSASMPIHPTCVVHHVDAVNSSAPIEEFLAATLSVRQAFAEARQIASSDVDVYDEFATRLEQILRRFGHVAFDVTGRIVLLEGTDPRLGLSALRAAGQVQDRTVHRTRLNLASNALQSSIPEHRYGALHVLADVADVAALRELLEAARRERIVALRADIERLIELLRHR
jgi:hypothetical protein